MPEEEQNQNNAPENESRQTFREKAMALSLRSEQRARARQMARIKRLGAEKGRKAAQIGGMFGKAMRKAAEMGNDGPYIVAIAASVSTDFLDMADLSLGVGIDQILDFGTVLTIFATRLLVKSDPKFYITRLMIFVVELMPGVGFVPFWSIASFMAYIHFRKERYKAHTASREKAAARNTDDKGQRTEERGERKVERMQQAYDQEKAAA